MRVSLVILISLLGYSCVNKKDEVKGVDYFLEIKKEKFKQEQIDECKEKAIEEAEKHVDALIDRWAKDNENTQIEFPRKPNRPVAPKPIINK